MLYLINHYYHQCDPFITTNNPMITNQLHHSSSESASIIFNKCLQFSSPCLLPWPPPTFSNNKIQTEYVNRKICFSQRNHVRINSGMTKNPSNNICFCSFWNLACDFLFLLLLLIIVVAAGIFFFSSWKLYLLLESFHLLCSYVWIPFYCTWIVQIGISKGNSTIL